MTILVPVLAVVATVLEIWAVGSLQLAIQRAAFGSMEKGKTFVVGENSEIFAKSRPSRERYVPALVERGTCPT